MDLVLPENFVKRGRIPYRLIRFRYATGDYTQQADARTVPKRSATYLLEKVVE